MNKMVQEFRVDMKHTIQRVVIFFLLMSLTAVQTWAGGIPEGNIRIQVLPENSGNSVTISSIGEKVNNKTKVIIQVTKADSYTIYEGLIQVVPMIVLPNEAPRRAPGFAGTLPVSSEGENLYSFEVPEEYDGAYVTARFVSANSTTIYSLDEITTLDGQYTLGADISGGKVPEAVRTGFTGSLNGNYHKIYNLSEPLFESTNGARIYNLMLEDVSISKTGNLGAITRVAEGATRIYNCGILSGSVGGSEYVGGLVGLLDGTARVINCFSYADVSGGTDMGGIVGYNNGTTTSASITTMVMNCMFYGDISSGGNISPVYGGKLIDNLQENNGLNSFNYYRYDSPYSKNGNITSDKYNCALAAEEEYLTRVETYRQLLNSNRKLAAYYALGDADKGYGKNNEMAKWVLETADQTNSNPKPYPVLKPQGYYHSIINYDAAHAPQTPEANKSLTINFGTSPLPITDKDPDHYNFNYHKVQLPYYDGADNYTDGKVVVGWQVTSYGTSASEGDDVTVNSDGVVTSTPYNFADRMCTTGRVYSQGAYLDVPKDVTSITLTPKWANAVFVADKNLDKVYNVNYDLVEVNKVLPSPDDVLGTAYTSGNSYTFKYGDGTVTVPVYTDISTALSNMPTNSDITGTTVYDKAVVLVGNLHLTATPSTEATAFTVMSADFDKDHEPDFSLIYTHPSRATGKVSPIRFDFLNMPGMAMAQKPKGSALLRNVSIFKPTGWFEVTNTCLVHFVQFECDNGEKTAAPVILLGGVYDQFVSTQSSKPYTTKSNKIVSNTSYIYLGGNAWFKEFGNGTHSDGWQFTPHVPISVSGGDFGKFYLSGTYRPDAMVESDNAECYISGGRFGELAGAGQQQIDGNVYWQIRHADIDEFYGGGINAGKPITGDINIDIKYSNVKFFCGGPKFGDMQKKGLTTITWALNKAGTSTASKTKQIDKDGEVTTNAEKCNFGNFYGAGYGGNSYYRVRTRDKNSDILWGTWQTDYTGKQGKYYKDNNGIATDFDYEYFIGSDGTVYGRFYVQYASFSMAQTNDVTSTLTDCKITGDFYGGGCRGKVNGKATSTLIGCNVDGNVFGGGYSASVPNIGVRQGGFASVPTFIPDAGVFGGGTFPILVDYTWTKGALTNGSTALSGTNITTDVDLSTLGQVKETDLKIQGTTTVGGLIDGKPDGGVFGGGDASAVYENTKVTIAAAEGSSIPNVFGGGNLAIVQGSTTLDMQSGVVGQSLYGGGNNADVSVNTKVTMSGGEVHGNVYGGGKMGSVGTITNTVKNESLTDGFGLSWPYQFTYGTYTYTNSQSQAVTEKTGKATVTITGGRIGTDGNENGYVFGGGKGTVEVGESDMANQRYAEALVANVRETEVKINYTNTAETTDGDCIVGSVFGGGEDGHVYDDATITITKGLIGQSVYGGGRGKGTYRGRLKNLDTDQLGDETDVCSWTAGRVYGNTNITMTDGHVIRNIYGGGNLGSVGKGNYASGADDYYPTGYGETLTGNLWTTTATAEAPDNAYHFLHSGKATVKIQGGVVGTATGEQEGLPTGNIFGSSRGRAAMDVSKMPRYEYGPDFYLGYANETEVEIGKTGETTGPTVYGSVYGGGRDGHVRRNTKVTVFGGTIGVPYVANADLTNIQWKERGNVFGSGSGMGTYVSGTTDKHGMSSGSVTGCTEVNIKGGTIYQNVYGGGALSSVGAPKMDQTYEEYRKGDTTDGHGVGKQTLCEVNIEGGNIGTELGVTNNYGGHVFGAGRGGGLLTGENADDFATSVWTEVNIKSDNTPVVNGSVFGGGEQGLVKCGVNVNVTGGEVKNDVYGGGAKAHTNTANWDATANSGAGGWANSTSKSALYTTAVSLTGGTIHGEAYGGGLGQKTGVNGATSDIEAMVYGDVLVDLNGTTTSGETGTAKARDTRGCVVHEVFGCNNIYGTPKGDVMVHVYGTQHAAATMTKISDKYNPPYYTPDQQPGESKKDYLGRLITAANGVTPRTGSETETGITASVVTAAQTVYAKTTPTDDELNGAVANVKAELDGLYDVYAVYGGGNRAAYEPQAAWNGTAGSKCKVIIEGCDYSSIQYVYGGGNAAPVPETNVLVKGTKIIDYLFGGGNGTVVGADVGYKKDGSTEQGTGNAQTTLMAGTIHYVYGASNTNGNIRGEATIVKTDNTHTADTDDGCCSNLHVNKMYSAGKDADMTGGSKVVLGCMAEDWIEEYYGGAENANVLGDVELTITSGNFRKVFGGNKTSGAIFGHIKLNIEETGCIPIQIDELYGCGNEAPYSIYGYSWDGTSVNPNNGKKIFTIRKSATDGTPVKPDGTAYTTDDPFTAYANPEVNIISATHIGQVFGGGLGSKAVVYGSPTVNINMIKGTATGSSATDLGTIGDVFGGGNEAKVDGNTTVNIGTATKVVMTSLSKVYAVEGDPEYVANATEQVKVYQKKTVEGAHITRDVFGGGNQAEVTGNTQVIICAKYNGTTEKWESVAPGTAGVTIDGTKPEGEFGRGVFGGGNQGNVNGDSYVYFGGGSVNQTIYGGGCDADVLGNTHVTMVNGYVFDGVCGGGLKGSVGTITEREALPSGHQNHDGCLNGKPKTFASNTGKCTVVITAGQVGPATVATQGMTRAAADGGPVSEGWVWGAGRGVVNSAEDDSDTDFRTYVNETDVTIGGTAFIMEGVIGGGEFGRVRGNTLVKIQGQCQIGVGAGTNMVDANGKPIRYSEDDFVNPATTEITSTNALKASSCFPYGRNIGTTASPNWVYDTYDPYADEYNTAKGSYKYPGGSTNNASDGKTWIGCVFGGGSGYFPYKTTDTNGNITNYDWLSSAGLVEGNTEVRISGGHILTNVYGGNEYTNVKGTCTVQMSGGTIGVPRTLDQIKANPMIGNVFGAGKGDPRVHFNKETNVGSVVVNITGGIIYGSVFGGGEDGHVLKNVSVTIGKDDHTGPTIGSWGTSYFEGNVFGGGRGFTGDAYTAGNVAGCVDLKIKGGSILGSVYGGGRLGSVGYGLFDKDENGYGQMRDDSDTETGFNTSGDFTKGRGHIDIEISGGTIGNRFEYDYIAPTVTGDALTTAKAKMPNTEHDAKNILTHTKGGNVFAGGMGRMYQLDGTTAISAVDWWKMGCVKSTKLTISGDAVIKSCVYGGGELGQVVGYHSAKNAANADVNVSTEVVVNGGTIGTEIKDANETVMYTFGSVFGGGYGSLVEKVGDTYPKYIAGRVKAGTKVSMTTGTVRASVYGGGEMAAVGESKALGETLTTGHTGDTHVIISGGTIGKEKVGTTYFGGAKMGNVYGGGSGAGTTVRSGHVYGNTNVTINAGSNGEPKIYHNVYGGGAYGTVGDFDYNTQIENNAPKVTGVNGIHTQHTNSGVARVTINGGTIGVDGHENGMVFGSSRGDINVPGARDDYGAWVNKTYVTIGTSNAGPDIKGSVYGSGENGHVFTDTEVAIHGGTIGVHDGTAADGTRGNVYGGGCGTDKYTDTNDENKEKYNPLAGIVQGNATVNISGGHVVRNVYGAGAMGSVGTASDATSGKTTITVTGGRIGYDGNSNNDGNIFGAARGDLAATGDNLAQVRETEVNISYATTPTADNEDKNVQLIAGSVFGGGEAGKVKGSVAVNMTGGLVLKDVYGGGALADTQTSNWDATANSNAGGWATGKSSSSSTTTVRLTGGRIVEEAYGGGLGEEGKPAFVWGDVLVDLNGTTTKADGKPTANGTPTTSTTGCVVGQVFGGNNINGTPKGDVMVHVYATQNQNTSAIAAKVPLTFTEPETDKVTYWSTQATNVGLTPATVIGTATADADKINLLKAAIEAVRYDVSAVYGGGNKAAYVPVSPYTTSNTSGAKTQVIIEGCSTTSIETVYGGGNAAAVPETNVEVRSAYEIGYVFGGGNGYSATNNHSNPSAANYNPGADIGVYKEGSTEHTYGTGNANAILKGGFVHEAYGGSNQMGQIKGNVNINTAPIDGGCDLCVDKLVGAGKNADVDGDLIMILGCKPTTKTPLVFAGADNADVNGNVELTITSGTFGQVFGGNNLGGAIKGHIILNIEETGCNPIVIDELYLGGNQAAYSRYGYYEDTSDNNKVKPRTAEMHAITDPTATGYVTPLTNPSNTDGKHPFPYAEPVLNVISCTSIGKVFGGGLGEGAVMHANPMVNINMIKGTPNGVESSNLGTIGDVFGGGNAADVVGSTTVNIGTATSITVNSWEFDGDKTYTAHDRPVEGANIVGNVYGGGKEADVIVSTQVNICAVKDATDATKYNSVAYTGTGYHGVTITGNVFGGGKGTVEIANSFECKKAMVGIVDTGNGSTSVIIGNGTVAGNVFGGGEVGRVEHDTEVTVGLDEGTSTPVVKGSVFGAGSGLDTHGYSALVRGSSTVIVQGNAKVQQSVYGGGEKASVGRYYIATTQELADQYKVEIGEPYDLMSGGKCTVIIQGNAEIGPDGMQMTAAGGPDDAGHVFGAGKGVLPYEGYDSTNKPWRMYRDDSGVDQKKYYDASNEADYFKYIKTLALNNDTEVTIAGNAFVKGSVYGGSENGRVRQDTKVKIQGGQIGAGEGMTEAYKETDWAGSTTPAGGWKECAHWTYDTTVPDGGKPYDKYAGTKGYDAKGGAKTATDGHTFYGNVFGGGSGYYPYAPGKWYDAAGQVYGNTLVEITGGHILTSVYGGNEMTDVKGDATINMVGGTVGVPRTEADMKAHPVTCNIFGAGKGDPRVYFNESTDVANAYVNISGTARIYGSTFGGGEDGHVDGNVVTNIGGSVTIGAKTYVYGDGNGDGVKDSEDSGVIIGTTGTSGVDGNVFGAGRGYSALALTIGLVKGNAETNIMNGKIYGSVFGGGRSASVGTQQVLEDDPLYGKMIDCTPGTDDDDLHTLTIDESKHNHGHIAVNISGGEIGRIDAQEDIIPSDFTIGDVFGGGKGLASEQRLGLVKDIKVNISGDAKVYGSVYGGGEISSVGNPLEEPDGNGHYKTGIVEVNIYGNAQIGTVKNSIDEFGKGYVYGGGKGNAGGQYSNFAYVKYSTVTIGAADSTATPRPNVDNPTVYGSVFGGGEDGHVRKDAAVYIKAGTIGSPLIPDSDPAKSELYFNTTTGVSNVPVWRGNVYAGGRGVDTFEDNKHHAHFSISAGAVYGKARVKMTGGHVYHNIYGSGSMASVGTIVESDKSYHDGTFAEGTGDVTIDISGGIVGDDTDGQQGRNNGRVFGGGRGLAGDNDSEVAHLEYVNNTTVNIRGGEIYGAVYGGGENGHVRKDTHVNISGGVVGYKLLSDECDVDPEHGATGNAFRGNVFGGGRGVDAAGTNRSRRSFTAGRVFGNTYVTMTGGRVLRAVYGGGLLASVGQPIAEKRNGDDGKADTEDDYMEITGWNFDEETNRNGIATVNIIGGLIGNVDATNTAFDNGTVYGLPGYNNGAVFGSGCGLSVSDDDEERATTVQYQQMGYVYRSYVNIAPEGDKDPVANDPNAANTPVIRAAVFGSGENGHVYEDTYVTMNGGTLGGKEINMPFSGNLFGSGRGLDLGTSHQSSLTAGKTNGNTHVRITNGTIWRDVYGGGNLASVGNPAVSADESTGDFPNYNNTTGLADVEISGGTIHGNVYGGSRGIAGRDYKNNGYVKNTKVVIKGTARIEKTTYGGNVFGGGNAGHVRKHTYVVIGGDDPSDNPTIAGNVFGAGAGDEDSETAGMVCHNVQLDVKSGLIKGDVYGGGAIADTNCHDDRNTDPETKAPDTEHVICTTKVNLNGGIVLGDAYGGGQGVMNSQSSNAAAQVFGNVTVTLDGTAFLPKNHETATNDDGSPIPVAGRVFGCNNFNGSPKGTVLVIVTKTKGVTTSGTGEDITYTVNDDKPGKTDMDAYTETSQGTYELGAVYGGGNLAAYEPDSETGNASLDDTDFSILGYSPSSPVQVVIDGCGDTSIKYVYGGGNAAPVPSSDVLVLGTYEIADLFGGGNGKDDVTIDGVTKPNPGANVGYYNYSIYEKDGDTWKVKDDPNYDTKEKRLNSAIQYGTGKAAVNIFGGTIHRVFGGSNTKGNVRQSAITLLEDARGCEFCVDEAYGGGKSAPMDAEAKLLMACIPGLKAVYGGAQAADVYDDVTVTVTNGNFDRVFGGNNLSGTIRGKITVNVEETGCRPVIIGELYGGGNQAGYSVYGYNDDGSMIESGETPLYQDPQVNVRSFTSIGNIYGGGYGEGAKMVGNPTVNINESVGSPTTYPSTGDYDEKGFKGKTITVDGHEVTLPSHTKGKIGAINNVFGGGNAARVIGNTQVNIGTETGNEMNMISLPVNDTNGKTPTEDGWIPTYTKRAVTGADIRGNVYGGGNNAEVTGNTNVTIGKKKEGE